jgi:hypothetical protein
VGTARSTNSSATDGHAKSEPAVSSALRQRNTAATWKKTFGFHPLLVFLTAPTSPPGKRWPRAKDTLSTGLPAVAVLNCSDCFVIGGTAKNIMHLNQRI